MSFLQKLRNLPTNKRKLILWLLIIILGVILFAFYIKNVQKRIKSLEMENIKQELQIPELEKGLDVMREREIPKP